MKIPFEELNPSLTQHKADELLKIYGAHYWEPGEKAVYTSSDREAYHYQAYVGEHTIDVESGDSIWWLEVGDNESWAHVRGGPVTIDSKSMAIVVRGYKANARSAEIGAKAMVLPYVNACSTREVFAPPRLGDPTLQHLTIPALSAEQAHHIHSTTRVVYVLRGKGVSVVGMDHGSVSTELLPGMVCILDPMSPHHFETPQGENIEVIPFHVFSAMQGEFDHAMFRGTFLTNQGE